MRLLGYAFAALFAAPSAGAQPASLSGFVTDAETGLPVYLATVQVVEDDGTTRGAVTDTDGVYFVTGIPPGRHRVRFSYVGYVPFVDTLDFEREEAKTLNVELTPGARELGELTVEAERNDGAARLTAGHQRIRPADIELLPAPDVGGDLATYLTSLPGVVSTGDRGGQLYIRGGEPSQNLVLLDGAPVYQPFHMLGFYSAFPAALVQQADVYAGGYPAAYGERVSSVIDVTARNGNLLRWEGETGVSPFLGSARLEGPVLPGRVSVLAHARRSLLESIAEPVLDEPLPYAFGDVFAKVYVEPSGRSRLAATALHTTDRGTVAEDAASTEEVRWRNTVVSTRYLLLPRSTPASAVIRVAYARLTTEFGPAPDPARRSAVRDLSLHVEGVASNDRGDFTFGLLVRGLRLDNALGGLYQNTRAEDVGFSTAALYAESDLAYAFAGGTAHLRPGLRMQVFQVKTNPFFEPRLRLTWTRGPHQFSAAAGRYAQEVVGLTDRRDAGNVFTAWTNVPRAVGPDPNDPDPFNDVRAGRLMQGLHGIAGYRVHPGAGLNVSVEGYARRLTNLSIAEWTAYPHFTTNLQPATGRTYGLDVRAEWRPDPFYLRVGYGLSNTRYEAEQVVIRLWYGEETLAFRPPHDRRHQLGIVGSATWRGFDLGVRWDFGSGLPFSRAVAFDGFTLIDDIRNIARVPGRRRVIYERPYNAVLPTYHRLDVSLARTVERGRARFTLQASALNLYDRRNLFYLDVFTLRRVDQLPRLVLVGLNIAYR